MSEHKIIKNNSKNLIICFGGMALKMGGILPFEFLNYLSKTFQKNTDLYIYIDKKQCWYHKGIDGITNNIDEIQPVFYYMANGSSLQQLEQINYCKLKFSDVKINYWHNFCFRTHQLYLFFFQDFLP